MPLIVGRNLRVIRVINNGTGDFGDSSDSDGSDGNGSNENKTNLKIHLMAIKTTIQEVIQKALFGRLLNGDRFLSGREWLRSNRS